MRIFFWTIRCSFRSGKLFNFNTESNNKRNVQCSWDRGWNSISFHLYVAGEFYRNLFCWIILTVSLTFQTRVDFTVVSRPKSDKNLFYCYFKLWVNKACFKRTRRATAVLSWLDCSSISARHWHVWSWFQTSNLIQSNRTAVAENKTQKYRNGFANFKTVF